MVFFGNILSSTIKVVEKVVSGDTPDTTVNLLGSVTFDGLNDLTYGDL